MSTATQMDEMLTIEEIYARFDSEWVLVEDPEVNDNMEVVRGKLVWHSKDRDEVYRKDMELRPKSAAYVYTGTIPEDAVVIL